MPSLFVSHGAPTLAIDDSPAHDFLRRLGAAVGRPRAIVVLSAHFDTPQVTVTSGAQPETVHDFGRFAPELFALRYAAPGDAALARRVIDLLAEGGVAAAPDPLRGFDHGAWVPLLLLYPEADVPVVQVSIDSRRSTAWHRRLGRLLRPLRDEGVLLLNSGGATHNLAGFRRHAANAPPPGWVTAFDDWVAQAVLDSRDDDLVAYRAAAPDAVRNHPTEEHFLPLLCAVGAARAGEPRRRVHHS